MKSCKMERKADEEEYYLNALLEEEILKSDQLSTEEWMDMYEIYASKLLKFVPVEKLSKRSRLCIAMVIVGAKVLSMYPAAFRIICNWQSVGGCYWIVQEEVLRHAAIQIIKEGFQSSGNFDSEKVKMKISKFLPTVIPSFVTHVKLREKLSLLSKKIQFLVTRLEKIENPKAAVDIYCNKYPLDEYVKWFLIWAYSLLRKPIPSKSATKCQQSIHFMSIVKPKISSNLPIREAISKSSISRAKDIATGGGRGTYYSHKPKPVSGGNPPPSNQINVSSSSKRSTFHVDDEAAKSINRLPPLQPQQPVASDGFRTPDFRALRTTKTPPFTPFADDDDGNVMVGEVQKASLRAAATSTEQLTISRRVSNINTTATATGVEESGETLQVTVAALSALPKLSKQEKIQQLFLSHRSTSDGSPLADADRIRASDEGDGDEEGEEESLSTLSYGSSIGSSTASSADDDEEHLPPPPDSHTQHWRESPANNNLGNRKSASSGIRSPSFVPYSANAVAEGAEEYNRKRGLFLDGADDEDRPSWRDAKRRRFYYHHPHPTANMTLSERIGHLIWEMFSPRSGAGADSDDDRDADGEGDIVPLS